MKFAQDLGVGFYSKVGLYLRQYGNSNHRPLTVMSLLGLVFVCRFWPVMDPRVNAPRLSWLHYWQGHVPSNDKKKQETIKIQVGSSTMLFTIIKIWSIHVSKIHIYLTQIKVYVPLWFIGESNWLTVYVWRRCNTSNGITLLKFAMNKN